MNSEIKKDTLQSKDYSQKQRSILILIFIFLITSFTVNSVRHAFSNQRTNYMIDFQLVYVASHVLNNNLDPYNRDILDSLSLKTTSDPLLCRGPFMYPPAALLVYYPFTYLKWESARWVYSSYNILMVIGTVWLICNLGGYAGKNFNTLICALMIISLKFIHLQLITGQPAILSFFFGLLALYFARKNRSAFAVVFLVMSLVKPTITLPFLILFLFRRKTKLICWSLGISAFINILILSYIDPGSMHSYFESVRQSFSIGGINDYAGNYPFFFYLTDIRTIIFRIIPSRQFVDAVRIIFLLGVFYFFWTNRKTIFQQTWNILIAGTFISLLFLYHQTLDLVTISVVLISIKPFKLIQNLKWKNIFLAPLFIPLTGFIMRIQDFIPPWLLDFLLLNVQFALVFLFVIWISAIYKSQPDKIIH